MYNLNQQSIPKDRMEKYKRTVIKSGNPIQEKQLEFQILSWWDQDKTIESDESDSESLDDDEYSKKKPEELEYVIKCFGATQEGQSVQCSITGFKPYYFIKLPIELTTKTKVKRLLAYIEDHFMLRQLKDPLVLKKCGLVERKDIFGFNNSTVYKYLLLTFTSKKAFSKSRYIFKKAVDIPGLVKNYKFKLYESSFDPYIRFAHISDIKMAGWVSVKNIKPTKESKCNISLTVTKSDIKPIEKGKSGTFLQASWDIEVYSANWRNGEFPHPLKKINGEYPNEIIQIGTTFQYSDQSKPLVKHIFTLKTCPDIPTDPRDGAPVVVECCKTELELIKKWVKLIRDTDPDIMYTYNGDAFDCDYVVQRCTLYRLANKTATGFNGWIFNELSRLNDTPGYMKKEFFSSSAYGDNEYNRMYIPGRLNYDLMIHYKRGMQKFDSYKLENIAMNIVGEGKHNVTAIDIFKMYERGTPDDLKVINSYCIQDTYLLQKLVDKQLILPSIIQLANVTFVPISYLLTRGQTIKVMSQIMRKAREMGFLVPDTNFNENNYPMMIKSSDPLPFSKSDIGVYATIDCGSQIVLEEEPRFPKNKIECKIVEIGEPNEQGEIKSVICKCDLDLIKPMYNLRAKFGQKRVQIKSLAPLDDESNEHGFTGAVVLDALTNCFYDDISVLDFASLYPTIIMGFNLDYSTLVENDTYRDLPDTDYLTLDWDDKVTIKINGTCQQIMKTGLRQGEECGKPAFFIEDELHYCRIHDPFKKTRPKDEKEAKKEVHYNYTIVQKHKHPVTGEWVNKGVLPALLEDLYAARKWAKKKMSEAKERGDKNEARNYDALQLATKVSLNSCYGFLGRSAGNLVKKELAQLVTYCGRKMINQSKEFMEGEFLDIVKNKDLITHTIRL